MDMFKEFAVDERLINEGVWHVIVAGKTFPVLEAEIGERCAILVASMDKPDYAKTLQRKAKAARMLGDLTEEIQLKITNQALAEVIFLDWRNWEIDGKPVPYSKDKAVEFLTDLKWVRLRAVLMEIVTKEEVFNANQEALIVKNS